MPLANDLRTKLLTVSAVTAITSRIYVDDAGQDATMPYVIIAESAFNPLETMDAGAAGLEQTTVDVFCVADRSVELSSLDAALYNAMKNLSGSVGDSTVQATHLQGKSRTTEQPDDGSQNRAYITNQTYNIYY